MTLSKMSEAEREIMQIIWASGGPVTSNDILTRLPDGRDLKTTTVLTFLARLGEKGLVKTDKVGKKNLYLALVTEEEYKRFESRVFLKSIHRGSLKNLVAALCADGNVTADEIDELKKWLNEQ